MDGYHFGTPLLRSRRSFSVSPWARVHKTVVFVYHSFQWCSKVSVLLMVPGRPYPPSVSPPDCPSKCTWSGRSQCSGVVCYSIRPFTWVELRVLFSFRQTTCRLYRDIVGTYTTYCKRIRSFKTEQNERKEGGRNSD